MQKIGFDNQKYIETQSAHIRERIGQFGGKLYLEFGGKLFDDYHASRVLPGFAPDSKIRMLQQLRDDVEIVVAICAGDIEKSKVRGDLGIPYEEDVLRLIDVFRGMDLYVGSVVVTQYSGQRAADAFLKRLDALGVRTFRHYPIAGYPHNVELIVSEEGYGRNDYIETSRPLVVVTAPDPAAARWPPASASSTTKTGGAGRRAMPSLRPSPCGTCPSSIRSIWPMRRPRLISTM